MIPSQVAQLIENSLINDKPKYKEVVPDLSELKNIKFVAKEHEYTSCPISMGEFKDGDTIVQLPCGHIFDKNSIIEWVTKEKANCPVCRHKLKAIEVSREPEHPPPTTPTFVTVPSQDISNNFTHTDEVGDISGNNIYNSILNMITTPRERQNSVFRSYFQRALGEIISDLQQENDIVGVADNSLNYINHFRNFNRHVQRNNLNNNNPNNEIHDVDLQRALLESMSEQNEN
mgnify:CR=1 FL=1